MNDLEIKNTPNSYTKILKETEQRGFTMPSDLKTCSLLKTLVASKPFGNFLELGTGTGLSTSWMLDGMDSASVLTSVDNDSNFQEIAHKYLRKDHRLTLVEADGEDWIRQNSNLKFDLIFADTWPGKYSLLAETLQLLDAGGIYIIDDMLPQPNWPEGHDLKAKNLIAELDSLEVYSITKMEWSTGLMMLVKLSD